MSHERATRLEHQLGEANETIRTLRGDLHAERATNKVLTADVERLEREVQQQADFKYKANQRADDAEAKAKRWQGIADQRAIEVADLKVAARSETQPQLTKGEIEALIDHHDFNESGADAMGIDGSAEYHRKRRAEFTALREKMK